MNGAPNIIGPKKSRTAADLLLARGLRVTTIRLETGLQASLFNEAKMPYVSVKILLLCATIFGHYGSHNIFRRTILAASPSNSATVLAFSGVIFVRPGTSSRLYHLSTS